MNISRLRFRPSLKSVGHTGWQLHKSLSCGRYALVLSGVLLLQLTLLAAISGLYAQNTTDRQHSGFPVVAAEEAGFCPDRLARLSNTLTDYADAKRLSGGVMLVARDGHAVFFEAFGKQDVEADIPMPRNAMFRIASQTKAIISAGIMILQEEGLLLISDPVSKYLPEYEHTSVAVLQEEAQGQEQEQDGMAVIPSNRAITIRDLLTHTSGIGYGFGPAADLWKEAGIQGWYLSDRDEPIRETVRRIASLPFDAHPGERFVYGYSNDILGAVIEVVSGLSLDRFLQDRIFDPLSMPDTHFYVPEDKADRLATVYSSDGKGGIVRAADPGGAVGQGHYLTGPRKNFSGGAGLVSTAADYARFLQMILNGGELDGRRVLSPHTVDLMTSNHLDEIPFRPGLGIGLGFDVVTNVGIHGVPGAKGDFGWGGAYHSTYWASPQDRLVVVFLTQLIPSGGSDIHGKVRTLIYQALVDG